MKANYKPIGNYVNLVGERNKELQDLPLIGLSITKKFIPSIANTIGTDMSTYRTIYKNQFAYSAVTSRNGDKLTIALFKDLEKGLISQAYTPFEITDTNKLLPDYLMMWFSRPEFDRYARFKSHGSARELFSWDDLCETLIPVPHPDKQKEIVKEYNTIVNRIALNNQLIKKLEETAQAIYKQWFVDFEFPNENGKPYKSNGGEMVESELGEIPKGYKLSSIGEVLAAKGYIRGPFGSSLKKEDMTSIGIPVYEQQHAIDNHRNFRYFISHEKHNSLKRFSVKENDFVISCSGTLGKITVIHSSDPIGIINQALLILRVDSKKLEPICFKYFLTSSEGNKLLIADAGGSAQVNIAKREQIASIKLIIPDSTQQKKVTMLLTSCDNNIELLRKENICLLKLQNILLSKLATIEN